MANYSKKIIVMCIVLLVILANVPSEKVYSEDIYRGKAERLVKVTDKFIFYKGHRENLYRMDLNGDRRVRIVEYPYPYQICGEWIYYVTRGQRLESLRRMKHDGSEKEIIFSDKTMKDILVIRKNIFYANYVDGLLKKIDINGKNEVVIYSGGVNKIHIPNEIDDEIEEIYFYAESKVSTGNEIFRTDLKNDHKIDKNVDMKKIYEDNDKRSKKVSMKSERYLYLENSDLNYITRKDLDDESNNDIWKINMDTRKNYVYGEKYWLKENHVIAFNNGEIKNVKVSWEKDYVDTSKIGEILNTGKIEEFDIKFMLKATVGNINSIEELIEALVKKEEEIYFGDEELENYFQASKKVVREIINPEMSDIEKEIKIIEFLNDMVMPEADISKSWIESRFDRINKIENAAVLLNLAGLKTHISNSGSARWNVVQVDGKYYNLEPFGKFPNTGKYSYGNIDKFNLSDNNKLVEYFNEDSFKCDDDRYNEFNYLIHGVREYKNLGVFAESEKSIYQIDANYNLNKGSKKNATTEIIAEDILKIVRRGDNFIIQKNSDKSGIYELNGVNNKIRKIYESPEGLSIDDFCIAENYILVFCNKEDLKSTEKSGVYVVNVEKREKQSFFEIEPNDMEYYKGWLYYSDTNNKNQLYRININNKNIEHVSLESVEDIYMFESRMYYTENTLVNYTEINKDFNLNDLDENIQTKSKESNDYFVVDDMKISNDKGYMINSKYGIWEFSDEERVMKNIIKEKVSDIFITEKWVYYYSESNRFDKILSRVNLSSGKKEEFMTLIFDKIAVSEEFIYTLKGEKLCSINIKTREENLISDECIQFELDKKEDKLYYINGEEYENNILFSLDSKGKTRVIAEGYFYNESLRASNNKVYYGYGYAESLIENSDDENSEENVILEMSFVPVDIQINKKYLLAMNYYVDEGIIFDIKTKEVIKFTIPADIDQLILSENGIYSIRNKGKREIVINRIGE